MQFKFHTLDVFTPTRLAGNPVAVVHDADALSGAQMQAVTKEFNLSETVFLLKPQDKASTSRARIFFPGGEMAFAGHPTLGTAILLAGLAHPKGDFTTRITLELPAGLTPVDVTRAGDRTAGMLTAPVVPFPADVPLPSVEQTAQALRLQPDDIGFDGHMVTCLEGGPRFFYVPVKTRSALAASQVIEPYWSELLKPMPRVDAAYVYARGGDGAGTHFRARMYAPTGGIPEDPATGSATALLAAQLLTSETLKDGTHRWQLEQGYEMGRPSDLRLEADIAHGKLQAVRVGGEAVRVMEGMLSL
jgi:trans-2,3-dihydro-3-hydroxyanthranilate isomerase